jgi:lysozyme
MTKITELLRRHEGVETHAYKCTAGKITIGVGRNIDPAGGLGLSQDEIDYLLENDIARVARELGAEFPWFSGLSECRRDAMIDLCFQLGITRLRLFKLALGAMENHNYEEAARQFLDSNYAKQTPVRAQEIASMIETDQYPA